MKECNVDSNGDGERESERGKGMINGKRFHLSDEYQLYKIWCMVKKHGTYNGKC